MNKKITLLLDGDITPTDRLKAKIDGTYVIAADGGIRHAQPLGIEPDLWVGDFDSAGADDIKAYANTEKRRYLQDKAKSDGELALEEALARKPTHIYVCGASGGNRFDHALMNVAFIQRAAMQNPEIRFEMVSGTETIFPIICGTPLGLDIKNGTIFTVFAFSELKGLSISGVKWPLSGVNVPFGSTLTLSNETIGKVVTNLGEGHAIAIVQNDA